MEYIGEVIPLAEYKERAKTTYKDDKHSYGVLLNKEFVIDARKMGNICRFINHACSPNCELQEWKVNGIPRLALYTKRSIQAGEELTYHYHFAEFGLPQICFCQTEDCKQFIGSKTARLNEFKIPKLRENQ